MPTFVLAILFALVHLEHLKKVEEKEDPVLPPIRPPFISESHYLWMARYFQGDVDYNPVWMDAYHKGGYVEAETPAAPDGEDPSGGEVKVLAIVEVKSAEPLKIPSWVHTFNNFILLNQVLLPTTTPIETKLCPSPQLLSIARA